VLWLGFPGGKVTWSPRQELVALAPGFDLGDFEARHGEHERCGEVRPHRVAVEVGPIQGVPRCFEGVTFEGFSWVVAFGDDLTVEGFDAEVAGGEVRPAIGCAERGHRRAFLVQPHGHLPGRRILRYTLDGEQIATADHGGAHRRQLVPAVDPAVRLEDVGKQFDHDFLLPTLTPP
jgi:hypothetical protein